MTNDEKVALVEKAKGIVEGQVEYWTLIKSSFYAPVFKEIQLNSWLALQSFFKRHEAVEHCKNPNCHGPVCKSCGSKETVQLSYPCPEAVTTADLIVNGVKE